MPYYPEIQEVIFEGNMAGAAAGGQEAFNLMSVSKAFHFADVDAVTAYNKKALNLSKKTLAKLNGDLKGVIADGLENGLPTKQIRSNVTGVFNDLKGWEADRIARTETTRGVAGGALNGYGQLGIGVVEYVANAGACAICSASVGELFPLADANNVIPQHPNCFCFWIPRPDKGAPPSSITPSAGVPIPAAFNEVPKTEWNTFEKNHMSLSKELTEQDFNGINNYMASGNSFRMNNKLRGKVVADVHNTEQLSLKALDKASKDLSSAISKGTVDTNIKAYRGVTANFPELDIGDTFIDNGFTSLTLDINHAQRYVFDGQLLEVRLPEGTNALWEKTATESKYWGKGKRGFLEKELVLEKGTEYRFIGTEIRPDGIKVSMLEIVK